MGNENNREKWKVKGQYKEASESRRYHDAEMPQSHSSLCTPSECPSSQVPDHGLIMNILPGFLKASSHVAKDLLGDTKMALFCGDGTDLYR
jgi:hypothetical protein